MTKFKNKSTFSSFRFAVRGLLIGMKSQRNFRTAFLISLIVLFSAVMLKFSFVEMSIIVLVIGFVCFAELVNTAIEYVIDTYFRNKHSEMARISKDVAAGSVLTAILCASIIGSLLFFPKIIVLLMNFSH
ncbi:MAG TPA: diacylglycerol kinase [Candidatus Gastranaerophilales bacterium]|nr:diacylglycerol kinase [Candidatus Gastranaerophilales bacterium]